MFKVKINFGKNSLKRHLREYKSAIAISFFVGVFIATIPYIYKFIDEHKNQRLIEKNRKIQIEKKEKICKNNSDYKKFLSLGFPDTATRKFNNCMQEK